MRIATLALACLAWAQDGCNPFSDDLLHCKRSLPSSLKVFTRFLLTLNDPTAAFRAVGCSPRFDLNRGTRFGTDVVSEETWEFDLDDLDSARKIQVVHKDSSDCEGFVDTHCHLDFILPRLSRQNRDDARKAKAAGQKPPRALRADFKAWRASLQGSEKSFEGCVHIGCSANTLDVGASFLANEGVHAAFGIHPLNAEDWCDAVEKKIKDMMSWDKVVALGECGLDYFDKASRGQLKDRGKRNLQRRVFARQMELAVELDMPLVVHIRDAEEDALELMTEYLPASHPVHVHCFTSSSALAQALLKRFPKLYIGFTGVVTFKNAAKIRKVVQQVPLERILLETDGPYMAPEPFRGRIAHPGHIVHIAEGIANLKGVPRQDVLSVCRENARSIYGF